MMEIIGYWWCEYGDWFTEMYEEQEFVACPDADETGTYCGPADKDGNPI